MSGNNTPVIVAVVVFVVVAVMSIILRILWVGYGPQEELAEAMEVAVAIISSSTVVAWMME